MSEHKHQIKARWRALADDAGFTGHIRGEMIQDLAAAEVEHLERVIESLRRELGFPAEANLKPEPQPGAQREAHSHAVRASRIRGLP